MSNGTEIEPYVDDILINLMVPSSILIAVDY